MVTKHIKRYSTSLISEKYKSKLQWDTIPYSLEWLFKEKWKVSVGEDVEKLDLLCIAGGNVKWCGHWWKQDGSSLS